MVICLERGADLHTAQLMPLPLTVSCFSKIQIGFTFLVLAHPGSPGKRAAKRVCVCVCKTQYKVLHNCPVYITLPRAEREVTGLLGTMGACSAESTLLAGDAATSSISSTDVDGFRISTASSATAASAFYNKLMTMSQQQVIQ